MRYGRCHSLLVLVLDAIHLVFYWWVYIFQGYNLTILLPIVNLPYNNLQKYFGWLLGEITTAVAFHLEYAEILVCVEIVLGFILVEEEVVIIAALFDNVI